MDYRNYRFLLFGVLCLLLTSSLIAEELALCPDGTDTCYYFDSGCLSRVEKDGITVFQTIESTKGLEDAYMWKLDYMNYKENGENRTVSYDDITNMDEAVSVNSDPIPFSYVNEMGVEESGGLYIWTHSDGIIVYTVFTTVPGEESIRMYIQVDNDRAVPSGWNQTQLMQIHFPFVRFGPGSLQREGEDLPPADECYLSMDTFVIKEPGHIINATYPDIIVDNINGKDKRRLWHGTYASGEGLPFHMFYETHIEPSVPEDSFFMAVYNSFGYPCEVNFYKHVENTTSDGTFYWDIVQFPTEDVMIPNNDLITSPTPGRPGFYIELRVMDGGWYEAADYYRERTHTLAEALENPPPAAPPLVPSYDVEPVWTTDTLRDTANMPEWMKTCPFVYYVSTQVSADNYNFEVTQGDFPVYNRAMDFMETLYETDQHISIEDDLEILKKAVVFAWHSKPISPDDWPEYRGGKVPITSSNYDTYCFQGTTELWENLNSESMFRTCGMYGSHYWYDWDHDGKPETPPVTHPMITDYGVSPGSKFNADWGFDLPLITDPPDVPEEHTYVGSIPREEHGIFHYFCIGAEDTWQRTWCFGDDCSSPRSGFQSLCDSEAQNGLIRADSLYLGAFGGGMCLGDFQTETPHAHPRNGSNWMTYCFRTAMENFQSHYSGEEKFWITEAMGEPMLRTPVVIAFGLFPPFFSASKNLYQDSTGTFSADMSGRSFNHLKMLEHSTKEEDRFELINLEPVPIAQVVLHEKHIIFDGMNGWVTGTQFHRKSGTKLDFTWAFYKRDDEEDPTKPLLSLNADLAYSYAWGNRFIIEDVDMATNAEGTPLPEMTPAPFPPNSPPPESSYSFLEEPYYASSREFLGDMLASYIFTGLNNVDRVYKSLFRGKMMKPMKLKTIFLDKPDLAYDLGSGFTEWWEKILPFMEMNNVIPVLCSAWRTTNVADPGEVDPYGERVVFTFVNFNNEPYDVNIQDVNLRDYFSMEVGAQTYYMYEYVPPGGFFPPQEIADCEKFAFEKSFQLGPRSVKNFGFFRRESQIFPPGKYATCNDDPYPDQLKLESGDLNIYPGTATGIEYDPVLVVSDVKTFQCFDLNNDGLSDFICLSNTHCSIYTSRPDFAYDLVSQVRHHAGLPKLMERPVIEADCIRLPAVFSDRISEIKISSTHTEATLRSLIEFDVTIEKAVISLIDKDEFPDAIITTSDGYLLGIQGIDDGMEEILEYQLPEDVTLSCLKDVDDDGDPDVVLEYSGKGMKSGKELVITNNGGWKFE